MNWLLITPRFFLAISAFIHIYVGITFFIDPYHWMKDLNIEAATPAALTELKTIYGGLLIALGSIFLYGACVTKAIETGLFVMGVTYAGAVIARSIGIFWYQAYDPLILDIYVVELFGLVSSLIGGWMLRLNRNRQIESESHVV